MIELIIVVGVILIISALIMPRLFNSIAFGGDQTKEDAQEVAHLFALGQSRAAGNSDNDHWGIRLVDDGTTDCNTTTAKDCAVFYKGKSFSGRDSSYDQIFVLRNNNYWTALTDIDFYFVRKTGFARSLYGLPHDPVGHWPFTASSTVDISGNVNDGTLSGAAAFIANNGANDSGYYNFDGSNGYVDIPNTVLGAQNTTGVTYAAWVRPANNSSDFAIVGGAPANTYTDYASGGIWLSLGKPEMVSYNGTAYCRATHAAAISVDWHHVVGTYTVSDRTARLYVDGDLSTSATTNCSSIQEGMTESYIGQNAASAARRNFNGRIDEVMIFDRALSASEVSQLFVSTRPTTTTVGERVSAKVYVANGFATSTVVVYNDGHAEVVDDKN